MVFVVLRVADLYAPCQVEVETLEFSASERKLYDSIYIDVRKKFLRLTEKGLVNKNYTSILAMLMRHDFSFLYTVVLIPTALATGFVGQSSTLALL
jgi:glycyl-tRNA synthetase alpha subunit